VAEYGNAARDDVWRDPYATTVRVSEDRNADGCEERSSAGSGFGPGYVFATTTANRP